MHIDLSGKTALVTGSIAGIGFAIAKGLAASGAEVVLNGRAQDRVDAALIRLQQAVPAARLHGIAGDVAQIDGGNAVVRALPEVDILVNNAGITRDTAFHKMTLEQWSAVINTNLGSLFNMTRPVIEGMRARKFGRIINISSINGQKGQFGQVNYSAAKAGDIGFTKALALETAKAGITVNVICPGYINTEMVQAVPKDVLEKAILPLIPVGRLGEPEEIARAVVFLAADEAGAITGSTLSINGGQYMA